MVRQVKDVGVVTSVMAPYLPLYGFCPEEFTNNDDNVCLLKGGDLSLFEKVSKNVYEGHYFFQSRGKSALRNSEEMLRYFITKFKPEVVKGLVPLETLGARWMSRQLGFKSHGAVQTIVGPCELFILTKEEWESKINE